MVDKVNPLCGAVPRRNDCLPHSAPTVSARPARHACTLPLHVHLALHAQGASGMIAAGTRGAAESTAAALPLAGTPMTAHRAAVPVETDFMQHACLIADREADLASSWPVP